MPNIRTKTPFLGKGPQPFSWGKYALFWHTLGKGVSNLTQTFNEFFRTEKQKAPGNTNKAVKDLNSTPSFNLF
jgi:hypothetical protein